jgi:hypothetical protein
LFCFATASEPNNLFQVSLRIMSNTQLLADGLCLRFSGEIAPNPSLTVEMATNILLRGTQAASTVPFIWGYIDRPQGEKRVWLSICMQKSTLIITRWIYISVIPRTPYAIPN